MSTNTTRNFQVVGTGSFAGQGGPSTGCGVPAGATGISATITTLAAHNGFLKAWSYGTSAPVASFMNFGTSFNASTGGVIALAHTSYASVQASVSSTNVIIDITGYYVAPLRALVYGDGTLIATASSRVTSTTHLSPGEFLVYFDRNVSSCTPNVTSYFTNRTIEAVPNGDNAVFVAIQTTGGDFSDIPFYLTVTC